MGWDDGGKGNPWRPDGNKGPADLDAIVKDFQRKLARLFGGGRSGGGDGRPGGGQAVSSGLIATVLVLLVCVWALSGFYKVDAAERGVVLRFGAYQATTQPGLQWHWPWPIEKVEKVNMSSAQSWSYQGSMLTRDENIIVIDLVVQYRRTDPLKYLFSMRAPEDTLHDVTASSIREVVGKNDLDFILTEGRAEVSAETQELLQSTLDSYNTGITVFEVNLQEANFPSEVESAVQDAVKAREDRERAILEAQEYSNRILPRARGAAARQKEDAAAYRAQSIADAEGEADRFSMLLAEYVKTPDVIRERLYLETLEQVLAGSTKVLVDAEGDNSLLYLPLDQLMRERREGGVTDTTTVVAPAPAPNDSSSRSSRERATR